MNLRVLICMLLALGNLQGVWEQPPQSYGPGRDIDIASDANGNAAVIFSSAGMGDGAIPGTVSVYNYFSSTDTWSSATVLQTDTVGEVDVAMDNSGTATVIWSNNNGTNEVRTAFYDGSTWTPGSPTPLEVTAGFVVSPSVAMNGPNSAVAAWIDVDNSLVRSSFLSGGVWSAPTTIAADGGSVRVAYSTNGTAVAGFGSPNPAAANYIGGSWQAPVPLDAGTTFGPVEVGIDASGNALAVWVDNTTLSILASFFDGSSWQSPITLGTSTGSPFFPSVAMAPGGTAVATWTTGDVPSPGYSRSFDGATWGPALQFAPDVNSEVVPVQVDDFGNAIVLFGTPAILPMNARLWSAKLPLGGGVWSNFQVVSTAFSPISHFDFMSTDLSNNGYGFGAWVDRTSESFFFYASVDPVILPPVNIQGSVCKNKFATQTDRINVITFTPSPSPGVTSYELRRNGVLIAVIPGTGPFIYLDHNRCKNVPDVYTLVAVGVGGVSTPVTVTVQ